MSNIHYVYLTTNLINGKQYVGDHTINIKERKYYIGSGNIFTAAIKKYKRVNFFKEILEWFDTRKEAFDAQEKYIKIFNTTLPNGYNISPTGGHNVKNCFSEQTLKKLSDAGKKPKSDEHKRKISESLKGQISWSKGKTGIWYHSEKSKKKMRKPHGKMSEEAVEKNRVGHLKENLSEETINKMRNAAIERWNKRSLN
jgi:hypothetical protein